MSAYWSLHTHSRYSAKDALSPIRALAERAVQLGYPALGLTDHGTPAGLVQLYKACRKVGIKPAPGMEIYMTADHGAKEQRSNHLTVAAYTTEGYRNLVRLSNVAAQNFYYRPRVDIADLVDLSDAGYTKGLVCATGCRSGLLVRTLMNQGPDKAVRVAANLAAIFPRTYVEVMNHGFTAEGYSDDDITRGLVAIANEVGLPLIVTGDSHYVEPDQQRLHDGMKELLTFAEDPADGRFHGCGYHLVDAQWLAGYLEPDTLAAGLASLAELANDLEVAIPELDTFTVKVPDITYGGDPDAVLATRVWEASAAAGDDTEHTERITEELAVIKVSGMAGYLLCVAMITDMMTEAGIWFWTRGSAGGSLVLQRLGITQDDSVRWRIRMDRFLSGDRMSMPDVDLDIDTERRPEVVAWVAKRFATRQVSLYSTYGLDEKAALTDEQKGSLKVEYYSTQRKRGVYLKQDSPDRIPREDWEMLTALADLEIIKNTGTHPSGWVVADSDADLAILPMARVGKGGATVTAYDKDDLELVGFPKFDLLGLKMIRAMRICCELIEPRTPKAFFDAIPLDDPGALEYAGSGDTTSLFQLEGWAQRTGVAELEPKRTYDLISAQALFRPGVSKEFLATYMRRRRGEEPVPAVHTDIATELSDTYGVAIFQEQVVGVLRNLGMPPLELTAMLKAVKASGKAGLVKAKEAVAEALPGIIALAEARGWDSDDITWLESALTDYGAGYSFGKAHSVRYGIVAYRCAYLARYHPLQYWTGVLVAYTGHKNTKKEDMELAYAAAARRANIEILPPHVNFSGPDYTMVEADYAIRRGLTSIRGIGPKAAEEIASKAGTVGFDSLVDFGRRCNVSGARELALGNKVESLGESTVVRILHNTRALEGLT